MTRFATARKARRSAGYYVQTENDIIPLEAIKLQPHGPRVMVQYEDEIYETINGAFPARKAASGLFIPKVAITRKVGESYPARVLAVGNGRFKERLWRRVPCSYKVGDRVCVPNLNFPIEGNETNGIPVGMTVYIVDEAAVLGLWP